MIQPNLKQMQTVTCREKGGTIERTFRLMQRDIPTVLNVVEKLEKVPNFLYPIRAANYQAFLNPENTAYLIDDVGIVFIEADWKCHITFWDGHMRGREELCRTIGRDFLESRGVRQGVFTASIIAGRGSVIAFARRVGFKSVDKVRNYEVMKWTLTI